MLCLQARPGDRGWAAAGQGSAGPVASLPARTQYTLPLQGAWQSWYKLWVAPAPRLWHLRLPATACSHKRRPTPRLHPGAGDKAAGRALRGCPQGAAPARRLARHLELLASQKGWGGRGRRWVWSQQAALQAAPCSRIPELHTAAKWYRPAQLFRRHGQDARILALRPLQGPRGRQHATVLVDAARCCPGAVPQATAAPPF